MATKDISTESASSRRLSGASALLSAGRLSLYTENGFRVLGMPVDATDDELNARHNVLKTYAALNKIKEVYTVAFGCEPPPNPHQLDAALERLTNDGEQRASDEFFWFWPRECGAKDDAGLEAIAEGNAEEALRVWREWEQEGGLARAVAQHNLAVNYLMLALGQTARHLAGSHQDTNEARLKNAWKNADKRWGEVAESDDVWEETKKRILSKDDRALTAAVADEMKSDLPKTLSAIHGDIARHYAEKGMMEWARFHLDTMLGDGQEVDDAYRAIVREITAPVRDGLEAARVQAFSYASSQDEGKKKQAFSRAKAFFENDFEKKAKPVLDLFYTGDSGLKQELEGIYDKVAATVCDCCVADFNAKKEAGESFENDNPLLQKAWDIAIDPKLKERIKKNMSGGGASVLEKILQTMADVSNDEGSPSARFRKLQSVRSELKKLASENKGDEQSQLLLKAFAILERRLSVEIFNKEHDFDLAKTAIECAIEDTSDVDDRKNFKEDLDTLQKNPSRNPILNIIKADPLLETLETMTEVSKDEGSPSARFRKLQNMRHKLKKWASESKGGEQSKPLLKAFAILERKLSVEIFNKEDDIGLAITAIECAIEDTPDADDRAKFEKDRDTLTGIRKGKGGKSGSSGGGKDEGIKGAREAAELTETFQEIADGKEDAMTRFKKLMENRNKFHRWADSYPEHELCKPMMQAFAGLERGLSVAMFNEGGEILARKGNRKEALLMVTMSLIAICFAIEDTPNADNLKQFKKDYDELVSVAKKLGISDIPKPAAEGRNRKTKSSSSGGRLPWHIAQSISAFCYGVMFLLFSFARTHDLIIGKLDWLQWWHFLVAGIVLGLLMPSRKPRALGIIIYFFVGMCFFTLLAWLVIMGQHFFVSEASAWGAWRAPGIGLAMSAVVMFLKRKNIEIWLNRFEARMKNNLV